MRVIVAGTKSFGVAALEQVLKDGHAVVGVVAPLDDKLHDAAGRHGLSWAPELHPAWVKMVQADLIVAAHCHAYIGKDSRAATRLGALVGHPSLLPRHRGRSSVEWTVRMGDPVTGFTWFYADAGVDTGPIAKQDFCHVDPRWTPSDLWAEALFPMGIRLLRETLADLQRGWLIQLPQDPRFATVEPSIEPIRLHRPELPAIGAGPEGFELIASAEHPLLAP